MLMILLAFFALSAHCFTPDTPFGGRRSVRELFGSLPVRRLTQEEIEAGRAAQAQDVQEHGEMSFSALVEDEEELEDEYRVFQSRSLLSVPSPMLSNAALESLAVRIVKVLGGAIMRPAGTMSCGVGICNMQGRKHEGVMYPPGGCRVKVPTACTSWGLSTSNKHRGSDLLHETMHMYTLRLQEAGKAAYHFREYNWGDEPFNDCLTQLMGGSYLNYGPCNAKNRRNGIALLKQFPPLKYPWQ